MNGRSDNRKKINDIVAISQRKLNRGGGVKPCLPFLLQTISRDKKMNNEYKRIINKQDRL